MVINKIVIVGVILIIVAICSMLYTIIFRVTSLRIRGIVDHKVRRGNGYIPVVRITYRGFEQQIECNETCKCTQYMEGEEIEVYFNPSSTEKVYIVGNYSSFVSNILMIGLGAFAIVLGMNM